MHYDFSVCKPCGHTRVRVFHMSAPSLEAGVETHRVGVLSGRVFGVAKTVADCFKYRGRIGTDVAIEALQEVVREPQRSCSDSRTMSCGAIDRPALGWA